MLVIADGPHSVNAFPPLSFPSPSFLSFSSFSYYLEYSSITTKKLSLQRDDLKSGIREEIKPSLLQLGDHWSQSSHLCRIMNTWERSYFTLLSSHPERVAGSTGNHVHFVDSTVETGMEPVQMRSSPWQWEVSGTQSPLPPILSRCDLVGGTFLSQATCLRDLEEMLSRQLEL